MLVQFEQAMALQVLQVIATAMYTFTYSETSELHFVIHDDLELFPSATLFPLQLCLVTNLALHDNIA